MMILIELNIPDDKSLDVVKALQPLMNGQKEEPIEQFSKIPKVHGKIRDSILLAVEGTGLNNKEIAKKTSYSYYSVAQETNKMVKEGLLEQSNTKPYIYYIKGENVDLKEALPIGTKVSVLK